MSQNVRLIDLPLFAGCVFAIILIYQLLGALLPLNIYFSFRSFLLNDEGNYRYVALAIKLFVPIIAGAGSTLIFGYLFSRSFDDRLRFYTTLRESFGISLFSAGFFAGLLNAWPQIAYWDVFADSRVIEYKLYFFIAYAFYFVAFGYFSLAGGLLCLNLLQRGGANLYFPGRETLLKFGTIARNGILGFIASGLGTSIIEALSSLK